MISSAGNPQIRNVTALIKKAKARREQKLFVVEGIRMFRELPPERIEKVYASESFLGQREAARLLEPLEGRCETVSDQVFSSMSDTQTPQGILALARQYEYSLSELLSQRGTPLLMVLETIQDPGNLGTMIRAGEGAGITGIVMDGSTADIYNPKVIRSTMGSVYRVPFVYVNDLKSALNELKRNKIQVFAAHLKGKNSYDGEDYTKGAAFLIGNEAGGLSDEISVMADTYVRIPMCGRVESLNAAIAASILMFEAARQRRRT